MKTLDICTYNWTFVGYFVDTRLWQLYVPCPQRGIEAEKYDR